MYFRDEISVVKFNIAKDVCRKTTSTQIYFKGNTNIKTIMTYFAYILLWKNADKLSHNVYVNFNYFSHILEIS